MGHLSNRVAGEALKEIISGKTQHVLLAHLSETNNTPSVAYRDVAAALEEENILAEVRLTVAPRFQAHQLIKIRRM